jgi:long-chain fatty acid transport protein
MHSRRLHVMLSRESTTPRRPPMPVSIRRASCLVLSLVLLLVAAANAPAGGLYLNEFGTPSMGASGAGVNAIANDASTAFHNMAGMVRLKRTELMITGGLALVDVKFDAASDTPVPGGDGGNAGSLAPLLGTFLVHQVSDDVWAGLSVVSVSAALLDFKDDWAGRYQVKDIDIFTISMIPSVAVRMDDGLSLGASLNVLYGKLEQTLAAPPPGGKGEVELDGDDWQVGFSLGALYEVNERTRLGLIYTSQIEPEFSGDLEIDADPLGGEVEAGVDAKILFPQTLRLSVYHDLNEEIALLGTLAWENWGAFDDVTLSVERGDAELPRDWDDVWKLAVGVRYRVSDDWTLMTGVAYDTSPTGRRKRTADMPIDRQIRVSVGAQYELNETTTIGAAFTYADFGDADIDGSLLKGKFESNTAYMLGFNVSFRF